MARMVAATLMKIAARHLMIKSARLMLANPVYEIMIIMNIIAIARP
mgnify:CR=1 FL=1